MKQVAVVCCVLAVCWAQEGRVVRPRDDEVVEATPIEIRSCPQDEWDSVKSIREYSNWTVESLPMVEGFTVMLIQSATTVSSRCYGTQIEKLSGNKISIMNLYPTQPASPMVFNLGGSDQTNGTDANDPSKQLMIAGASNNFMAYATCNGNSSHVNLLVTYKKSITEHEQKAINKWIKSSNLPMLGSWAAINFDTCSFTKTYLCNGGRDKFCASVRRYPKKLQKDSSEESDEDGTEGIIYLPW